MVLTVYLYKRLIIVQKILTWLRLYFVAAQRLFWEDCTYRASALAFTTLLGLVPFLTVIVAVVAVFPIFDRFTSLAQGHILANFLPSSSDVITQYFESFVHQASQLSLLGIFFLFVTAIMLILTIEHTLNEIWETPQREKKIKALLLSWLVLLLTPLFIGLSVLISSYIFSLFWFGGAASRLGLETPLLACIPLVINAAIFTMLYVVVPNVHVTWRDGMLGGLTAAVLFEVAKKAFGFYILRYDSYTVIYGALAAVPIFLSWLYISWLIILYGAIITHTRSQMRLKKINLVHPKEVA
jgi:membrane protein